MSYSFQRFEYPLNIIYLFLVVLDMIRPLPVVKYHEDQRELRLET